MLRQQDARYFMGFPEYSLNIHQIWLISFLNKKIQYFMHM